MENPFKSKPKADEMVSAAAMPERTNVLKLTKWGIFFGVFVIVIASLMMHFFTNVQTELIVVVSNTVTAIIAIIGSNLDRLFAPPAKEEKDPPATVNESFAKTALTFQKEAYEFTAHTLRDEVE